MAQKQRHCRTCGRPTLHACSPSMSDGFGCIITLLTGGLFLLLWLPLIILDMFKPWRCQTCGASN